MEINDRLLRVLNHQLNNKELFASQPVSDEAVIVSQNDIPVAFIQEDGLLLYPYGIRPKSAKSLTLIVNQVWEMERAYQEAPAMGIDSVSEYRKLLDYNGFVLAARYDGLGQFTFVNWQYTYDKTAVSFGHYFHKNAFAEAKEDFLLRSGLVEQTDVFRVDELSVIRAALLFRSIQDNELNTEDRRDLDQVLQRIESRLRPIDNLLLEAEAEVENER